MLTDEQYLEEYLKSFYLQFDGELAAIKDSHSNYIAVTNEYAQILGFKNNVELINLSDNHALTKTAQYSTSFYKQDRLAEAQRKEITCLDNHEYAHGFDVLLFNKKPIINPDTNNVLGVRLRGHRPLMLSPIKIALDMQNVPSEENQHNLVLGNFVTNEIELTDLQHVVLYLTIHNYSQRDIERVSAYLGLTISEETAKSTLKKLRHKFNVDSKEQLIGAARKLGLHIAIPAKLFKEGSFILNGYELQVKPSRT